MAFGKKVVYNENTEKYFLDEINKLKEELARIKQQPTNTTVPTQIDVSLVEAARDNIIEFLKKIKNE